MGCTAPERYYKRDPKFFAGVRGLTKDPRRALVGGRPLIVACGKCMSCRLRRSYEWSLRGMHEASCHPQNSFVTLTYDDKHLPYDWNLDYYEFQLFMHRLRKRLAGAGRFLMCGEYGEDFGRPHYHAILFNCYFPDLVFWKQEKGVDYYKSELLSELWGNGFVTVGTVTLQSVGYVARYSTKKIGGPMSGDAYQFLSEDGEVFDRDPPFLHCSLKPGIGYEWFQRYWSDVFPGDFIVFKGRKFPVPRYYSKLYEAMDANSAEELKRVRRAASVALRDHPDRTSRRLHDIAEVVRLQSEAFKRDAVR